jgi:hypothetical protein
LQSTDPRTVTTTPPAVRQRGHQGPVDSQVGARICNSLGIMRACLETQKLEQLEARMDQIAARVAYERTGAAHERASTHEAQRLSH